MLALRRVSLRNNTQHARMGDMKFIKEISGLSWTLAGTGLVLITLSGNTRRMGIVISVAGFVVHMLGTLLKEKD